MSAYGALLRDRGFAALWLAQLVSRIGDSIHEIALLWIVYEVTGDPTLLAVVALASMTPTLVLSLPAGAVVDRLDRKWLLVVAEATRGLAVLAIPLVGRGEYLVPVVIAVALLAGSMEAFFGPALQATVPRLVAGDRLDTANSLVNVTHSTSRLFYVVGGVVVGVGGSFVAFYLNAASFLFAALVLLTLPAAAGRPVGSAAGEADAPWSVLEDVREGIRFIRGDAALVAIIAMTVFVDFAFVPLAVVLPVFATEVLGGGGTTFGFLFGSFFAGAILGNALVGTVREPVDRHRGTVMIAATVATGVSVALGGVLPGYVPAAAAVPVALAGFALAGVCNPFLNVPLTTYAQAVVPDEKRGKVFSVLRVGITGAAPLGLVAAGPALDLFGPTAVLVGMGGIVVLAGLGALLTPLGRLGSVRSAAPGDGGD
jgi:MFS family permease